jgi:hypothetical protein
MSETFGSEYVGHAVVWMVGDEVGGGGLAESVEGGWVGIREYPSAEACVAATLAGEPVPKGRLDFFPVALVHFDVT